MAKDRVTALEKYIPSDVIKLTAENVTALVKKADTNELHIKYNTLMGFVDMFGKAVKEEVVERLKKQVEKGGKTFAVTEVGQITLVRRGNVVIDDFSLEKWIEKQEDMKKEDIFDVKYELVTNNKQVLESLLDKGLAIRTWSINKSKFEKLKKLFPKLSKFEKESPTFYVKGL